MVGAVAIPVTHADLVAERATTSVLLPKPVHPKRGKRGRLRCLKTSRSNSGRTGRVVGTENPPLFLGPREVVAIDRGSGEGRTGEERMWQI